MRPSCAFFTSADGDVDGRGHEDATGRIAIAAVKRDDLVDVGERGAPDVLAAELAPHWVGEVAAVRTESDVRVAGAPLELHLEVQGHAASCPDACLPGRAHEAQPGAVRLGRWRGRQSDCDINGGSDEDAAGRITIAAIESD